VAVRADVPAGSGAGKGQNWRQRQARSFQATQGVEVKGEHSVVTLSDSEGSLSSSVSLS
jgi:hypothetical protein